MPQRSRMGYIEERFVNAFRGCVAVCLLMLGRVGLADDVTSDPGLNVRVDDPGEQISAPTCLTIADIMPGFKWARGYTRCTAGELEQWQADLRQYRLERRIRVGYDGSRYDNTALEWTQSSFIQPQMMVQDRYFYDPVAHRYTVDRYLDDLNKRIGGIDAVLIWPTYPNMGIDNRNQHDLIRSMPGGVAGVRNMVADFHRRGVRVFFPMMMWDQGTRDPGMPWPQAIAQLMAEIGADGINGDTQDGVPRAFVEASEKAGHPLAFEPESQPHDEQLAYDLMTWGYYKYPFAPSIDRFKWLEPRHMVNISDRWNRDKTDDLQYAFFNGIGWESWENVWGYWNGITPRHAEATRRVATLERALAPHLVSPDWEPFAPTVRYGVFASRWPLGETVAWTLVNRNEYDLSGAQMNAEAGWRYFDLYHGTELIPQHEGDQLILNFDIEAHGYGAILASRGAPDPTMGRLMSQMKAMTVKTLASFSHEWVPLSQKITPMAAMAATANAPSGMLKIPAANFMFRVNGIEIEGPDIVGIDVQYPWENSPRLFHEHFLPIKSFWIDQYPVTNAQFKQFMDATHYHPQDELNFLRDWSEGRYPAGWDRKPVTWVSREDAQAYAAWAGKRLPHEWEWQYAAQGTDGRLYPWGNDWDAAAVPVPDKGRSMRGPDDVSAHPKGASSFGVQDLIGNVWQWTDEFTDDHTRSAVLRGGSYYQPQNSMWYFPQAYKLTQHGKLLVMAPSMDRSAAVGFRCVQDAL
jgi:gamma-glutamyl hercynylcysteine S-oxide synthase